MAELVLYAMSARSRHVKNSPSARRQLCLRAQNVQHQASMLQDGYQGAWRQAVGGGALEAGAGAGATRTRVLLGEMGERAMSRMWDAGGTHLGVKSASWLPVR